jgi:hypothetical protein
VATADTAGSIEATLSTTLKRRSPCSSRGLPPGRGTKKEPKRIYE